MIERSEMIAWIRGELVGPARWLADPEIIEFVNGEFEDQTSLRRGPLAWRRDPTADPQEVLYYDRESPYRKYGAGLLHPLGTDRNPVTPADQIAVEATDTMWVEGMLEETSECETASDQTD